MSDEATEVQRIIEALGMRPHPEGGWYVETFRDAGGGRRGHSTAIYFLLERGQVSHWHRVKDAVEIWHHHAGAPLELSLSADARAVERRTLGPDILSGQRPQGIVPANVWQSARSLGDWTLVGCTVAPGFAFCAFELAAPGWQPVG
ncbi:cupin domain-containing protein [Aquibium carbonis]|nr:cupin domain-containing protein [Aquibium carbonis]